MVNKDRIYKALAARFVNYQNLAPIPIEENGDAMIDTETYGIKNGLKYSKLEKSTGNKLVLREEVCKKLVEAQAELTKIKPGYKLVLVYAYRSMAVQVANFEKMKRELGFGDRTDPEAMERTHHFIAVPEVAGHPTGAAVDVLIEDEKGNTLDFGTPMHGLELDSYAYNPFISDEASLNRKLLRLIMQSVDFAPYDGEWWHFSFGDREWAAYYKEPKAFYTQLDYNPDWEK